MGPFEQIGKTIIKSICYEKPHRQKGHQLYDRLKGDGRYQSLVPFGGIHMTRAEKNGKNGQHQGDIKGRIAKDRYIGES